MLLAEPNTFLTPTSLALPVDRAVDKFMKLIADSHSTKTPMAVNILMNKGFPVGPNP